MREDLANHAHEWTAPGFQALAVYRLGRFAHGRRGLRAKVLRRVHRVLYVFVRNFYGIELPPGAVIGRRLRVEHQHGVVVNDKAVFGDDCTLGHNVTVGIGFPGKQSVPRIGDRVVLGTGAVVIGRVTIGDDVHIGPNALVMSDVPSGAHVVERPARVLQLQRSDDTAAATATADR
ncbi:MAG: putative Serine O-acetyltransferase [Actinomycetia bacterium]|nr:putative Serine O-acetyltransferase [Actinomycetes bacterium]